LYGCETWSLTWRKELRLRVFENRVLRRIFGPKRDEVTVEWRKIHTDEFSDLYSSQNIIWVIKSRRLRWAGHVVRMRERRGACRVLVGKLEGNSPLGRSGVDGRIILKLIFKKWAVKASTVSIWLRIGTGGGNL
jgi:ribosomal protein L35AE/L33A